MRFYLLVLASSLLILTSGYTMDVIAGESGNYCIEYGQKTNNRRQQQAYFKNRCNETVALAWCTDGKNCGTKKGYYAYKSLLRGGQLYMNEYSILGRVEYAACISDRLYSLKTYEGGDFDCRD